MTHRVSLWASSLLSLVCLAGEAALSAQANVEDQARRQLESGREFYRAGRFAEAIKDFETVAEGYPTSSVADDALLAVADYQLEVARDPISARTTADTLIKKYATADSAPMGYVIIGRATLEIDQTPAGLDSALASFDRVPRLFPKSDAMAPALYYGAEVDRRADRASSALDRLQRVALEFPRSVWAARSGLLESRLLVAAGQPTEALRALQRVIRRFPSSEEAVTARAWNTILYRVYLRASPGPAFTASGKTIAGPSGRLRDVEAMALAPDGKLAVATRNGILVLDDTGAITRQAPSSEPRQLQVDWHNRLTIVQRSVVLRETDSGMQRVALTAATSGGPRLLQDISAGALLSNGDLVVADRDLRAAYRFNPSGQFVAVFAPGRINRIALSGNDHVAMLDGDSRGVAIGDRSGKVLIRIPARGTGYELAAPVDLAFDVFEHLYVLERTQVRIFGADGKLLATFAPDQASGFRSGAALTLDPAGRLYIYDEATSRVVIFQ
jgi:outer membrane protein assembly factor BamD (BamD/ComL family)